MNCLIGISLTLIAVVAGMLLLAKTQKDNLGNVYKVVSYFVIIAAFIGFLGAMCCGLCRMANCGKGGCSSTENCYKMNNCSHGGMSCKSMTGCRGHAGSTQTGGKCCKNKSASKCKSWKSNDDGNKDEDTDTESAPSEPLKE